MITIGFTGKSAPLLTERCDQVIHVPHSETPKIQECHIMFGHIICAIVEDALFGAEYDPMRKAAADVA
jgi:D-sedoheptulose 7-phosphate isomerase